MLEKIQIVDRIEINESSCVQVRIKTTIIEDGKQISSMYSHNFIAPGDSYVNENARIQAICACVHTADVISAYKAAIAAQGV